MNIYRRIASIVAGIITTILLTMAFLFGIGPVALFSKLTGGRFLRGSQKKSSWDIPTGGDNVRRMY